MSTFAIGQRVRRNPAIWPDSVFAHDVNRGTVVGVTDTCDGVAYLIVRDCDRDGVENLFTGAIEPATPVTHLALELEAL